MSSATESLLLLLERPYEPVYFPKGENGVVFQPPPELLSNRHREVANELADRFAASPTVAVAPLQPAAAGEALPGAIEACRALPREVPFSVFVPWHRRLAAGLVELFMGAAEAESLRSLAVAAREATNPQLFAYALSVALLHRPDTRDLRLPPLVQLMPGKFLGGAALGRAYEEANLTAGDRQVIIIPRDWTANDAEPEHRLAYFREDIGVNLHHWHWHLVYPFDGPRQIVDKDRRGEMFYYMHQQIIARYNLERFSVGLPRVRRLGSFREPLREGYYPKLSSGIARYDYAGRPDNVALSDVSRDLERVYLDIKDLERWEARIFEAIHTGKYLNAAGEQVPLTEERGVDVIGNLIEASTLSPNTNFYGDLHNMLHYALGTCHDPNGKHLEMFQAVADPTTSMRDPVFYPLHAYIDDIFREHKHTLAPYSEAQLALPGLAVTAAAVRSVAPPGHPLPPAGELRTFLQESDLELSRGLDFAPTGPLFVRVQHLQHAPFQYTFNVENSTGAERRVTVRVFLGPRSDERDTPLLFLDHKNFFVEVDKFVATVAPGASELQRSSAQSSVTVPWEQTFRDVDRGRPSEGSAELQQFSYCGCGWPQHMLLPRGTADGLPCLLLVVLTDYEQDQVEGVGPDAAAAEAGAGRCKAAVSFCGLRDRRFPDRRPMGFPLERRPREGVLSLEDFVRGLPNMRAVDVRVRHTPSVLLRRARDADEATPA